MPHGTWMMRNIFSTSNNNIILSIITYSAPLVKTSYGSNLLSTDCPLISICLIQTRVIIRLMGACTPTKIN